MKLLHIADIHIGKRVSEFSLLDDQRFVLTQIINLVRAHHIDAILVAGDVYDKSLPSTDAVALVDWFFSKLAETGVPAIVIAGNHDSAERIAYACSVLARQGIHITPVYDGNLTPRLFCRMSLGRCSCGPCRLCGRLRSVISSLMPRLTPIPMRFVLRLALARWILRRDDRWR